GKFRHRPRSLRTAGVRGDGRALVLSQVCCKSSPSGVPRGTSRAQLLSIIRRVSLILERSDQGFAPVMTACTINDVGGSYPVPKTACPGRTPGAAVVLGNSIYERSAAPLVPQADGKVDHAERHSRMLAC